MKLRCQISNYQNYGTGNYHGCYCSKETIHINTDHGSNHRSTGVNMFYKIYGGSPAITSRIKPPPTPVMVPKSQQEYFFNVSLLNPYVHTHYRKIARPMVSIISITLS